MYTLTKKFILPLAAVAMASSAIMLAAVLKGQPTAKSDGVSITVHWESDDETGVVGYEIARKSGLDGPYIILVPSLRSKGGNSAYDFVDETAFRTSSTFYRYRITALFSNGTRSDPFETGVSHAVNSVRRTWGSIKAMFR